MHDHEELDRDPECPAWCRRAHHDRLHPDDQHHQSAVRRVGVVAGHPTLEPDDLAVPCPVVARLVRRTDSEQTWLELVSEEGGQVRLVVTLESALRLRAVLGELLAAARG
ncbi:MAG: hypothetical protein WAV00_17035 [Nocardioides sp.]